MKNYIYRGIQNNRSPREALEPGDYDFIVSSHGDLYEKNDKMILPVKLVIEPTGHIVFDNPWTGYTSQDEARDQIGEFLVAINRAPSIGEIPDWDLIDGAQGRCKLKVEIAQKGALAGKNVNKVSFYYVPKQLEPVPKKPRKSSGPAGPDLTRDPDEIPF